MKTHRFDFLGRRRTVFTRTGGKWYYRVRAAGRDQWICLDTTDILAAEQNTKDIIIAQIAGPDRFAALRESTRIRRQGPIVQAHTLAQLETAYRSAAAGRLDPATIDGNINALRNLLRRVRGGDITPEQIPITVLDGDCVHTYKQRILAECANLDALQRRRRQRTANSLLRQARSLFTGEMQNIYRRDHQLLIPPEIGTFLAEGVFKDVSSQRDDYQLPHDHLIARTFTELEKLRATDLNSYLAMWLALGFGLRKEEIAGVRARNFMTLQGQPVLELEEVWVRGRCKSITKNGAVRPRVICTNGAWPHLEPYLTTRAPDAHLLSGPDHERTDKVFRNVAAWLRALGWKTQKAIHEFRAYAGCQVAMRDGIYHASKWLRHSSVTITERHYARYISYRVTSAALQLPQVESGHFQPEVLRA